MMVSSRGLVVLASGLLFFAGQVVAQGDATPNAKPAARQGQPNVNDGPSQTTHADVASSTPTGTKAKTLAPAVPSPEIPFPGEWEVLDPVKRFNTEASFKYHVDVPAIQPFQSSGKFGAILAQTSAKDGEPVTTDNSWCIVQLIPCVQNEPCTKDTSFAQSINNPSAWIDVSWIFERNQDAEDNAVVKAKVVDSRNYFLCFGTGPETGEGFTCQAFSALFSIQSDPNDKANTGNTGFSGNAESSGTTSDGDQGLESNPPHLPTGTLAGTLSLTQLPAYITYSGMPPEVLPTVSAQSASTLIGVTVTVTTDTETGVPGNPSLAPSRGKKLSTGAIVGIALGSLVIVSLLAVLALFFCIRRRRRAQSAGTTHEKAMLTQDNNNSQEVAEKDSAVHTLIHPNSNDSTFTSQDQNPLIPVDATAYGASGHGEFRDAETHDLHETERSPPSSATPIFTKSSPPRRKPTNASAISAGGVSALSRNVSSATMNSTTSFDDYSTQHNSRLQNIGEEEGSVRYGESPRRTTQIFNRGSSASPFLSEGMSVEEVARLEDEERRIDAAIAAAEEARGRGGGGGSGTR